MSVNLAIRIVAIEGPLLFSIFVLHHKYYRMLILLIIILYHWFCWKDCCSRELPFRKMKKCDGNAVFTKISFITRILVFYTLYNDFVRGLWSENYIMYYICIFNLLIDCSAAFLWYLCYYFVNIYQVTGLDVEKTTGRNIKEHISFVVCICYFASNDFTCRHLQALIGG